MSETNLTSTNYTAAEIDAKLEDLKKQMIERIDSTIVMNSSDTAPQADRTSMWLKILGTDSK